jgi:small subunit ribosomal protein S16
LAVHIRLRRMGAKKRSFFRIVAADSRRARDGRFLEILGSYNPIAKPAEVKVFEERINKWLDRGAIPSDTVSSLLTQIGFTQKYAKAKRGEDTSEIALKTTITERRKKTRRMRKAAVATTAEETPAGTTAAEVPTDQAEATDQAK